MYCKYFGFTERPFEVSPDPDFLFLSAGHREMLASLVYGIQERRGLIAVIGEVGTGKTTMLKTLMEKLASKISYSYLFNSGGNFEEFLNINLFQLGLTEKNENLSAVKAIRRLQEFAIEQHERGGNVVLIVDEAQNLDRDLMENIRLLSNLETRKHKLIQIILSGQIELDEKLRRYDLRQLAQRINLRRYVIPLSRKDTFEYIRHRLNLSGYQGPALFSQRALRLIRHHSGGIPRKINVLCDNALLTAYGLDQRRVTTKIIKEAIADLNPDPAFKSGIGHRILRAIQEKGRTLMPLVTRLHPTAALAVAIGLCLAAWPLFQRDWPASSVSAHPIAVAEKTPAGTSFAPSPHDALNTLQPGNVRPGVFNQASMAVVTGNDGASARAFKVASDRNLPAIKNDSIAVDSRLNLKTGPDAPGGSPIFVIARKGDSLSKIVRRYYGAFSEKHLMDIIHANPSIKNMNLIEVGQAIRLPHPVS